MDIQMIRDLPEAEKDSSEAYKKKNRTTLHYYKNSNNKKNKYE